MMRINSSRELGLLIKKYRKANKMSQEDLANMIGASRFWVLAMEAGKPTAEVGLVLRALGALGVALDVRAGESSMAKQTKKGQHPTKKASRTLVLPGGRLIRISDINAIVSKARGRNDRRSL
jgi:HTH-type transcriptional regulator / antitoxin HipB